MNIDERPLLSIVVEKLRRFSSANNMTSLHEYFDQFLYEGSRLLVGTRYRDTHVDFYSVSGTSARIKQFCALQCCTR